jgi:CheY-like chemotaxis protein
MADDPMRELEERLASLRRTMERGLGDRARTLREMAARLEAGDAAARKALKTEGHKLRGIAGSYGHDVIGDKAAELEARASVSPPAAVGALARELAALADEIAGGSVPPKEPPSIPPPRPPGVTARAQMISDRPKTSDGARLRVLAIDDEPLTQRLLELTLREVGGFEATIVTTAAQALAALGERDYDVVVSDAMMPDMDGRAFCEAARAAGMTAPIVILSAASAEELGWVSAVVAPVRWLRKPFRPTELVHHLVLIVEETR